MTAHMSEVLPVASQLSIGGSNVLQSSGVRVTKRCISFMLPDAAAEITVAASGALYLSSAAAMVEAFIDMADLTVVKWVAARARKPHGFFFGGAARLGGEPLFLYRVRALAGACYTQLTSEYRHA